MNYSPLVYAANLPIPKKNEEVQKVLDDEEAQLADIIAKAEANAAVTKAKPCTTPSCKISWSSYFRKKFQSRKEGKKGGFRRRRTRKRNRTRRNKARR